MSETDPGAALRGHWPIHEGADVRGCLCGDGSGTRTEWRDHAARLLLAAVPADDLAEQVAALADWCDSEAGGPQPWMHLDEFVTRLRALLVAHTETPTDDKPNE